MKLLSITFYRKYRLPIAIFSLFLVGPWAFPQVPVAAAMNEALSVNEVATLVVPVFETKPKEVLFFPESLPRPARYTVKVPVTAYSSTPDQTDDTPFITASGTQVRWGVVAANFLPIGTMVRLPDHYGDQIFLVEDRMNARYDVRLDIWMETREEARTWGLRQVKLEVL